ncbi:hypothetical protein pEaSNUABM50_00012 [Erwinia phage pEa_SNUABM_50]|uniref:Uncharacterized protein n=4 Tax=Eneladusvirus BF TaxID=2560751 RepID=A0A7L8ZM00_9CAUD|nr:hypothetical protein FDH34_gp013 [Serratia phage BF]QOI70951.1 hypothetical protein pEaSNUABM12_00013 [Erwinia phage pEa_SNUABM_12]QOI71496.1 hypothetical protein pEaSNUABM47_00012 [Erwinia phage pEa_SNUABM_47]QOI72036.1 hypothetical protein pEaSNUABM50_00012 [Erwinia phage pEa_SNUABM_50]QXO11159.1 hypothetical protein pEaSNUABM19_00013 [Erwinia phage pEa_SNUABM_19]QXO11708.1 hypothetical protein pEaSNUABM44_00012 [Erwinia phage pEa_SNUABM_44]
MSKANAIVSMIPAILPIGTVVVHNYGEFTHGTIVSHVAGDMYEVFFPVENCPQTAKYLTDVNSRVRKIRLNAGFFISRFNSLAAVKIAQKKYKKSGLKLESI